VAATSLPKAKAQRMASVWILYLPLLVLAVVMAYTKQGRMLDYWLLDQYWIVKHDRMASASAADPLIIGIDEAFLEQIEEPVALTHSHLARLLYGLGQVSPKAVGLDLVLPEKRFDTLSSTHTQGVDYHRTLLMALMSPETPYPLMVAKTWDHQLGQFRDIMPDYQVAMGVRERPSGFVSSLFCADIDGIVRHLPGQACQPGSTIGLAEALFRETHDAPTQLNGLINYAEGPAWSYLPIQQALAWINAGDMQRLRDVAGNRIVLVGTTFSDTDLLKAPVDLFSMSSSQGTIPGVVIHAQILRTLIHSSAIRELPVWQVIIPMLLASLAWFGDSTERKSTIVTGAVLLMPWLAWYMLDKHRFAVPFVSVTFVLIVSAALRGLYDGVRLYLANQHLKSTFGGYVSPTVLAKITSGQITAERSGVSAQLCVLFSDIRGFTTLSERLPPDVIVDILNRYFDRMTGIVHKHQGTVDKFIGDGLMAFFGAPNTMPDAEQKAALAAQEMLSELVIFNREIEDAGLPALHIGIGLHRGEAIVGNVGARQRHAYTAIGDTVNTASRVEGLCKTVGYNLVCTQAVYDVLGRPDGWTALGEQPLKGRQPVAVYGWNEARSLHVYA
jgi:class 3 adenylate cyclase